jgi:hypothetical protein
MYLGEVQEHRCNDYAAARALKEQSVALCREVGEKWLLALALNEQAGVVHKQATALTQERLAIAQEMGDMLSIVRSLMDLGNLAKPQGSDTEAAALYQQGLEIAQDIGDQHFISWFLCN